MKKKLSMLSIQEGVTSSGEVEVDLMQEVSLSRSGKDAEELTGHRGGEVHLRQNDSMVRAVLGELRASVVGLWFEFLQGKVLMPLRKTESRKSPGFWK